MESPRSHVLLQMKRIFFILGFAVLTGSAFSYPISPQTLRKLIEHSEYIVIAMIDNPEKTTKYYDKKLKDTLISYSFGGDGLADLNIREVLKGKLKNTDRIQVVYEAGMICPAPPYYPDKSIVIAFLAKDDTAKYFNTVGLSYGSKIVGNEAEAEIYKKRILEYLEISALSHKKEKEAATIEWFVKCAENNCTRWEGSYELSREGYFMSYYDRSVDEKFSEKLTQSQMLRIDSIFFSIDTIGYSELCLANLISGQNYPKLKEHFIKNLSFADYYMAEELMKKVLEIFPNNDLQKIIEEADKLMYDDKEREKKLKKLVDKFIVLAKKEVK
jgi:hypothetical protein